MTKLIAVVGATGLQGGSVLKTLYESGEYKIRALTRNPGGSAAKSMALKYPGVDWVQADLDDVESLRRAFAGADAVFGVTQFFQPDILAKAEAGDTDAEFSQGKNITDAAIDAGVKDLVFSSLPSAKQRSGGKYPGVLHFEGKHRVEEYIASKADQIHGYFVYLGFYMENFCNFARLSPEDGKTIEFTFPLKPTMDMPLVDTANDTGPVVKYILDHPEECRGKVVGVSGGYYPLQDMVDAFIKVTGKPARYVQIPHEALGLDDLIQMCKFQEEFGLFEEKADLLEFNKKMDYEFTTPTSFWESRNWDGPSS